MAVRSLAQSSLVEPFSNNSMLAGYSGNAFHHLETVRLSSNAASVTFSNLARYSDFQHLQLRINGRSSNSNLWGQYRIRFNGDSGSNYNRHNLIGSGGSVTSAAYFENGYVDGSSQTGNSAGSGIFGGAILDILDAFDTNKNTTIRNFGGRYPGGDDPVMLSSGLWRNVAALDSILILNDHSWIAGSRFSLYGLKARS